jgi:hypothetical protein
MTSFDAGYAGRLLSRPRVVIVAMRADDAPPSKCTRCTDCLHTGALIDTVMQKFNEDIDIYPHLFTVDALRASSQEMKTLRQCISELKTSICRVSCALVVFLEFRRLCSFHDTGFMYKNESTVRLERSAYYSEYWP